MKNSSDESFKLKYVHMDGSDKKLIPGTTQVQLSLGTPCLMFNQEVERMGCICLDESMSRASIKDMRAAIFQIDDSNEELKEVKMKLKQFLEAAEQKFLNDYFTSKFWLKKI